MFDLNLSLSNYQKRIYRKMGYFDDQNGIARRYKREKKSWNLHLLNTKKYILDNATHSKSKENALILGSGWCFDIPVFELCDIFEKVYFVDIKHPKEIFKLSKNISNLVLVEDEITGIAEQIFHIINKKQVIKVDDLFKLIPEYNSSVLNHIQDFDYIASVNILNQLDILICDYIFENYEITELDLVKLRKHIQNQHINLLPSQKSYIISDYEELNFDKKNNLLYKKQLVHLELKNSKNCLKWIWIFDTHFKYHQNTKTHFKVRAFAI